MEPQETTTQAVITNGSCTVLMRKDKRLLLGKVNQDGADVFDFFDDEVWDMDFDTIWEEYHRWRLQDKSSGYVDRELETSFQNGIGGSIEGLPNMLATPCGFRRAIEGLHDTVRSINPADGILATQEDLLVYVDFTKQEVHNITEVIDGYDEAQHEKDLKLLDGPEKNDFWDPGVQDMLDEYEYVPYDDFKGYSGEEDPEDADDGHKQITYDL